MKRITYLVSFLLLMTLLLSVAVAETVVEVTKAGSIREAADYDAKRI